MKTASIIIFLLLFSFSILGQTPPVWQWATGAGGMDPDYGYAVDTDGSGNVYTGGYFSSTAYFGADSLVSAGDYDIFVTKTDPGGNLLWAARAGGTDQDYCYGLCTDASGNVYVIGEFYGTAYLGADTLVSGGYSDIFVAKLDAGGNWQWAVRAGGAGMNAGRGISLDGAGNICVTGSFRLTANFGTFTLTSMGNSDIYAAKLDAGGNWLWVAVGTGAGTNHANGIATDSAGNSFITGYFGSTATFGAYSVSSSTNSDRDVVIAKINSSGVWQWARDAGNTQGDEGFGIALDGSGNCYVSGLFRSSTSFGGLALTSNGYEDIFIVKYDGNGTALWARNAGSTTGDRGFGIAADADGNCYGTGWFTGACQFGPQNLTTTDLAEVYVCALDAGGNWLWAKSAGGDYNDYGTGITVDGNANIYCTGYFCSETANFGSLPVGNPGYSYQEVYLAKLAVSAASGIPLPPENLVISRNGADMVLQWDAVTEDTDGQPITPDYYEIYYHPTDPYATLSAIAQTASLSWTHAGAASGTPGFYYVKAATD